MVGKVYLIGAGPGDYKLMTLKGMEAIKKADVVIYDRLANENYLKETKKNCEFIYVGKASSNHTLSQDKINDLIIQKAKEGKTVARLKGGDPYVFGRGGEEGEGLVEEGIEFETIPGITSAIGGLCYAGIPITHRGYASSFHVITGHLKDESEEINFRALSELKGTLVFLMGMSNLKKITENLMANGKDKKTPVAIINWATRHNQRVVTGTLEDIYEIVQREGVKSPSLIVVGDVVSLREKLNFFEKKTLFGKNIIVTRARAQSSTLVEKILSLGGNPIEFPTIKINKIEPNDQLIHAIENLNTYNYIIFTSVNGVNIFFEKLFELGLDARKLGNSKIVAIGKSTDGELRKYGLKADIVPKEFVAESILKELKEVINPSDHILIPRAKEARRYLVDTLKELCRVTEIKTYETVVADHNKNQVLEVLKNEKVGYITFTSSSTVKNFISIIGKANKELLKNVKIISIGPITSRTIKDYQLNIYKEADEYTIDGVLKSIEQDI